MADITQLTELKEEITKLTVDGQKRLTQLEEQGKSRDQGFGELTEKFAELSGKLDEAAAKITAEEEERKQLESLMARIPSDPEKAQSDPEYVKAFDEYLRKRRPIESEVAAKNVDDLLDFYGIKGSDDQIHILKAGLVGSNPDGGFLAPIDPVRFISRRVFESSPVRQLANVISTAREAVTVVVDDEEAGSGWVGEVDARSETDYPQIAEIEIPTHEQYAEPKISTKALDDISINIEGWIQEKVAMRFARQEAAAFIEGTGVKQPTGILDYGEWATAGQYERNAIEHRDTATVGTLAGDDLIDLQSDLLEAYQGNATWLMHRKIWAEVMQLKDSDNQYLLNPMMLFSGVTMQLLGRPVRFAGDMEDSLTEDESIMIYGDFREGYTVVDRIGIRVLRDPYTQKQYVKFYTTKRVGGAVTNYQALKVLDVQAS